MSLAATAALALFATVDASRNEANLRRSNEALAQEREAASALAADPVQLAAHVARQGVNTPLPNTWMRPLEAAAHNGHADLARQMLAQGAVVSEEALSAAAARGDAAMVAAFLAHPAREGQGVGYYALQAAFVQSRQDILLLLAEGGVPTGRFAVQVIRNERHLLFHPGDVEWRAVLARWNGPALPRAFQDAIEQETREDKTALPEWGEKQVLAVLNALVVSPRLPDNPTDARLLGRSPADRVRTFAANWEYLRDFHPRDAIVPSPAGKGLAMLLFLTSSVTDKSADDGPLVLHAAVRSGDVALAEALVGQGYDPRRLELVPVYHALLRSPEYQPMRAYLERLGIEIPGDIEIPRRD